MPFIEINRYASVNDWSGFFRYEILRKLIDIKFCGVGFSGTIIVPIGIGTENEPQAVQIQDTQIKDQEQKEKPLFADAATSEKNYFDFLVYCWHRERAGLSSISRIIACDAYQEILAQGEKYQKYIIEDLKKNSEKPDYWFHALRKINHGDGPYVPKNIKSNFKELAKLWIIWDEKNAQKSETIRLS